MIELLISHQFHSGIVVAATMMTWDFFITAVAVSASTGMRVGASTSVRVGAAITAAAITTMMMSMRMACTCCSNS